MLGIVSPFGMRAFGIRGGYQFRVVAITAVLILAWLTASWLTAQNHYESRAASLLQQEMKKSQNWADDIAYNIKRNLKYLHGVPEVVAQEESVKNALSRFGAGITASQLSPDTRKQRWSEDPTLEGISERLVDVAKSLGANVVWILNAAGDCVAASNFHESDSFVGTNYAEREYFQMSKAGQNGQQYALGKKTNIPGLYFSSPVNIDGHFVGAVAAKMDMPQLSFWVDKADSFVVDTNGVVILARNKSLEMLSLPDAPINTMPLEKRMQRYKRDTFSPLQIQSWGSHGSSLARFNNDAAPHVVATNDMPEEGIRVFVTSPLPEFVTLDHDRQGLFLLLATSGSALIALLAGVGLYLESNKRSRIHLTEQRNQLDEAQRLAKIGSWNWNIKSGELRWSNEAYEIYSPDRDDIEPSYAGFVAAIHPGDRQRVEEAVRLALKQSAPYDIEHRVISNKHGERIVHAQGQVIRDQFGDPIRMMGTVQDITERKRREELDHTRHEVFEILARDGALSDMMKLVVEYVEKSKVGTLCSISLIDETGKHLQITAAPSLPDYYNETMSRVEIGDGAGSCGTAAYRGERVVVGDIRSHPYWVEYRDLAAQAGLASCWSEPVFDSSGKLLGTLAIYQRKSGEPDITDIQLIQEAAALASIAIERKRIDEELQLAASVYQTSGEAIMIADSSDLIVAVNPTFTNLTGYAPGEVVGCNVGMLASDRNSIEQHDAMRQSLLATGSWQGELWSRRKNGDEFAVWMTINTIHDEYANVHRRIRMFSDITDKKRMDDLVWRQANYDTQTGLPNRRLFRDRLQQELKKLHRSGHSLALLFIDLDRFKQVNDAFGHNAGDLLLREAARRITDCVRDSDTVARLGGDEFTVIVPDLFDPVRIELIAQTILGTLAEPFLLESEVAHISASIGITLYPNDAKNMEALLRNADQAMYAAKNGGRNRFSYFTAEMQKLSQIRTQIGNDLRNAVAEGQFEVYFQPIVELATGRIVKAEALLRWHHPERGMIDPAQFIPIAEEMGLINEIGDWVFKESARAAKRWYEAEGQTRAGLCAIQMHVNKSPRQFLTGRTSETWIDYLSDIGLPPQCIVIEITEGLLLDERPEVAEKLNQFRDAGIQIALDDFGTGYSAMSYLKRFRVDYLKLDQSFMRDMATEAGDRAIVEALIVMAHKLGLKVVAEGVETVEQRDVVTTAGCDYGQGYLFAKPMPAKSLHALLERERRSIKSLALTLS